MMKKKKNQPEKINYMPEQEGARGEWDAECEERREAAACIIIQRDYVAISAMNGLISRCHQDQIIDQQELCRDAYRFADLMQKQSQK